MPITLLISQQDHLRRVAYLKDGQVIDVDIEDTSTNIPDFCPLDQIYWGRVIRVESSHAFIKLQENIVGLLPFETAFPKPIEGQGVLVQVRREAIPDKGTRHKGPVLTRKIILGGRYCLFHPFQKKFHLSPKIHDQTLRNRLQTQFLPEEPFTLRESVVRASVEEIHHEIDVLRQKFAEIEKFSDKAPWATPYDTMRSSLRWMRDLDANVGNVILVDDDKALRDVRHFLNTYRPDLLPYVQKHQKSLFEDFGVEDFWDSLFQDVVNLPSGGNIVIDVTAAAIVIDVNQGDKDAHETNREAIPILIQQLKGRHLGGNIIIDFMGFESAPKDHGSLKDLLIKQAALNNLPLDVFGWSKLGWMEARLPKRRLPLKEIVNFMRHRQLV